ncbi:MAG TPA: DNA gyrase subunit A [Saccharofermentans sp.]|nr:DNA gyrase subunit A [Saccharofermentans sp.]
MKIDSFFRNEYCDYSVYDNYRKIGSNIDGLKTSARKILWTVMVNNIKQPVKVAQLSSKCAEFCAYIHGEVSLTGVAVGLAQNFVGSNNLPLLKREGMFGTRSIQEAAASRYIYTCYEDYIWKIFRKEDTPVLIEQEFEGDKIEPKFLLPIVPLIAINGSEGISTGFAQKILPRNPKTVVDWLLARLDGTKLPRLAPHYIGWKGKVIEENGSWLFEGLYSVKNTNTIHITEIPPQYDLAGYVKVLDKLQEDDVISDYADKSTDSHFEFVVSFTRQKLAELLKDEQNLKKNVLKLVKPVTENFTYLNLDGDIRIDDTAKSIEDIIERYMEVRLRYYELRRQKQMAELKQEISWLISRACFIKLYMSKELELYNVSEEDVIEKLKKADKIVTKNGSFDYLLNTPIRQLTKESLERLKTELTQKTKQHNEIATTSAKDIWKNELKELKEILK